jgi:Flp pilus assembly protein TadG
MRRIRWASRRSGDQRERGATLVEFALIVPILAMFVFGIIEFGVIYSNQINRRQGTRDAARMAVVGNFDSNASCTGTNTQKLVCMTRALTDATDTRVMIRLPNGASTSGNAVVVCAQRPVRPVTGIFPFLNNRVLTSKVEMRLEQSVTLTEFSEPSYAGTTWASACPA